MHDIYITCGRGNTNMFWNSEASSQIDDQSRESYRWETFHRYACNMNKNLKEQRGVNKDNVKEIARRRFTRRLYTEPSKIKKLFPCQTLQLYRVQEYAWWRGINIKKLIREKGILSFKRSYSHSHYGQLAFPYSLLFIN